MAAAEATAARERAARERADRRVAGVPGSVQDGAGRVEPAGGADAVAAPAAVEVGAVAARASDPPVRRASGDGAARGADAPSQEPSPRRGRDDDDDSLAKRLAGSGDQADRVVCKYIVDCFDDAVQKVVAHFDRRLARLTGEKDPAVASQAI